MKLRSGSVEDSYQELMLVLTQDGRRRARALKRLFAALYRGFQRLILAALRWRNSAWLESRPCGGGHEEGR